MPAMPLPTRWMSHSIESEKANTLRPLTDTMSFSRYMMMMSVAWSAMNTSPEPVTFITLTPSPVTAFLSIFVMPPEPVFSKRASPW